MDVSDALFEMGSFVVDKEEDGGVFT